MALRVDYFGLEYDDAHPAFIDIPRPLNPLDDSGGRKFLLHRTTMKLYDLDEFMARLAADGYTFPAYERGSDNAWLRVHTQFRVPYEFTWNLTTALTRDNFINGAVSGGPATVRQRLWLSPDPMTVDEVPLNYPYAASSVPEQYIEVGDTATQVAAKLRTLTRASWDRINEGFIKTGGRYLSVSGSGQSAAFISNMATIADAQLPFFPKPPLRLPASFRINGVNYSTTEATSNPPTGARIVSAWANPEHTLVDVTVLGFPHNLSRNVVTSATDLGFADQRFYLTDYMLAPSATNDSVAQFLAGAFPTVRGIYTIRAARAGSRIRFTVEVTVGGALVPFNFLPQWFLH